MSSLPAPIVTESDRQAVIYDRIFWIAYLANLVIVTANALSFRFADMVTYLGGDNTITGTIASLGTVCGLASRLLLGQMVDRYGTRIIWIVSSLIYILGALGLAFAETISWQIYLSRAFYAIGIGSMLTCSMVHIQGRVPIHRRTEVIGVLGSSGFVGMITGALLGDYLTGTISNESFRYLILFSTAAGLGTFYLFLALIMTHDDVHEEPNHTPTLLPLIWRYWPGLIILVSTIMGMCFTISTVFLTRFAHSLGFAGIGWYFSSYAISAFFLRLLTTSWIRVMSRRLLIVIGLCAHSLGLLCLPWVTLPWHLVFPAILSGFGHALLFPCVVSLTTKCFPKEYQGTANSVVLGSVDIGALIFSPMIGWTIDQFGFQVMFRLGALCALLMAISFYLADRNLTDEDLALHRPQIKQGSSS